MGDLIRNPLNNRLLTRLLMIVPPILLLVYSGHSMLLIRNMMSDSAGFHLDYANDLVQEYLAGEIALQVEKLRYCTLQSDGDCPPDTWVTTQAGNRPIAQFENPSGASVPVYLNEPQLPQLLPAFFKEKHGVNHLFRTIQHDPIYWFQILDESGKVVFVTGKRPEGEPTAYPMDRSLAGYSVELVYSSFGPRKLYSVARTRINFGLIFMLFILAVFSGFLVTRSIRQKLVLARQKSFFVSTVSHEFKTPLAIMKLAAETLAAKRFRSEEEEQKFLGMLSTEINRLNLLVHKVLSFNKIEMGQILFHNQAIDLRDLLQVSLDAFHAQANTDQIDLQTEIDTRPCTVWCDDGLVRHAVDNILDNAFKYRGDSNQIRVMLKRTDKEVRLAVKDQGVGIAREELAQISKSFYRVDDPKTLGIRGSGLGLAISRYILENSGARLEIESQQGEGSLFTIIFPYHTG